MGEVYRARDTKLEREVALKVLPAAVADDAGLSRDDRTITFFRTAREGDIWLMTLGGEH